MRIIVVGAGKMGGDVGLRFLRAALDVTFFERDTERRSAFALKLQRGMRRAKGEGEHLGQAEVLQSVDDAGTYDVLYEAVDESIAAKQAVIAEWAPRLAPAGLILTNTSSILPSMIDPRCLGLHAFYPTALTGFCEVIVPSDCPSERRLATVALAARAGLKLIVQDEARAFAVNRLMLPVQDWALRAVRNGADPEAVDTAAGKAWPFWEPLAMIDAIGLDTVASAVAAYRSRMVPEESSSLVVLEDSLRILVAAGKLGARVRDGIRHGAKVPLAAIESFSGLQPEGISPDLGHDFEVLFRNVCANALARHEMDHAGMIMALSGLFGVSYRPADGDLLNHEGREWCQRRAVESGLSYWRPSREGDVAAEAGLR